MSTILPFVNNTLTTHVYEPFSYTISNPDPGTYTLEFSKSAGIPLSYFVNNGSNLVFSTPSNGMGVGTQSFIVTATFGSTVLTSSNTVTVSAGRFLDASGASYAGRSFTFFKSEPVTPLSLVAPFAISVPTSVPTLPPGLTYTSNASNIYTITGTPSVTVPQSNYLVIGKATGANTGKIVTSQFGLSVSNERILLNLSGTPIVSPMTVGTPISQRVLTAAYPPYPSGGTLRYSWFGLPDGIVVKDNVGTTRTSPFIPTDLSSTLVITGTPTITAANAYRDAGISSNVVTFTATRTDPLPQISNSEAITFAFGETVLFDTPFVPTFYSGVTLDPSATFFRAQTYFGSASPISNIFSPDLRSDLSINFVAAEGRGYLTGTPNTTTGTASYIIRAINSNAISRDLSVPITVTADSVTFVSPPTPAVDVCYNFVLSRPSALALTGYYPSNIQFQAVAASGNPVTFSAPALAGTGLSLSNISSNTVQLVGIPDTITPLTTVTVTASATGTPATATRDISLSVVNDVITISDVSSSLLSFVQNRTITPIQFSATTLSERPVSSFSSANIPSGLTLSSTGLLTGAPTEPTVGSSTFTVTATTGFASQNKVFTYNTVEDNLIVVLPSPVTVPPVFSNAEFDILTYSGSEGKFSSNPITVFPAQSTSATVTATMPNFLTGNFSSVPVLAPEYRFIVVGEAGTFGSSALVKAIPTNPPTIQHTALIANSIVPVASPTTPDPPVPNVSGNVSVSVDTPFTFSNALTTDVSPSGPRTWAAVYQFVGEEGMGYDLARSSNVYIAVIGSNIIRSEDYGNTWSQVPSSNITTASNVYGMQYSGLPSPSSPVTRIRFANPTFGAITSDGTSNWWAMGVGTVDEVGGVWDPICVVRKSTDNGQTWTDVSLSSGAVSSSILLSNKLHYNQGRLFYTGRQATVVGIQSNAFYYADVSDLTTWMRPLTTLGTDGSITALAFSNSTAFAAGDDSNGTATFVSTNNGTNWSPGTNPNPGPGNIADTYQYTDVFQKYGYWFLAGISNGFGFLQSSSNLTTWQSREAGPTGTYSATTENGINWVSGGLTVPLTSTSWSSNGTLGVSEGFGSDLFALVELKRLYSDTTVNPSDPTLTLSLIYDTSGIGFVSPTQTQYTNWQFVPIPTIPVEATVITPDAFLYYYAAGLPRGLTLNLDASGIEASITGTSSQFNDAFQRVSLYAVGGGKVATLPLTMRTILPTVQKQQTSAGAWTSLVRQYTVVNAAQNSVNGKTLPSTEPPLGEFTRPEPPDSVSAEGNPNCQKC